MKHLIISIIMFLALMPLVCKQIATEKTLKDILARLEKQSPETEQQRIETGGATLPEI